MRQTRPATKPKEVYNVASLWAKRLTRKDATDSSDMLAPKGAGVTKAKHKSTAHAKKHPMFVGFQSMLYAAARSFRSY